MIKHVKADSLKSVFTDSTMSVFTDYARDNGVNHDSIIYITCDKTDALTFGDQYSKGSNWIWAKGSMVGFNKNGSEDDIILADGQSYTRGYTYDPILHSYTLGVDCTATGKWSQAMGHTTEASGNFSNVCGHLNKATGESAHAEGRETLASGKDSHTEGYATNASGEYSHAEGYKAWAQDEGAHAEGYETVAAGPHSHAEGYFTYTKNEYAHAEGNGTSAEGMQSHAEGASTYAMGSQSHAEGWGSKALVKGAHAEGNESQAGGEYSHSEGTFTKASGNYAHAEGYYTTASGERSHAEGNQTEASGSQSHSEGTATKATANQSHAEGYGTQATANGAHAEGDATIAAGTYSHAEGFESQALAKYSHVSGIRNIAQNEGQFVCGKYATIDSSKSLLFQIGVGTGTTARANGLTVNSSGIVTMPKLGASGDSFGLNNSQPYTNRVLQIGGGANGTTSLIIHRGGIQSWDQLSDTPSTTIPSLNLNYKGGTINVGGSIIPVQTDSLSLGSTTLAWNTLYSNRACFKGTAYPQIYSLNSDQKLELGISPTTTTGIASVVLTSSCFKRGTGKAINLGDTTHKWQNGYFSGSVYSGAFYESSDIRKKDIKGDIPLDKCYELIDQCQSIIYSLKGEDTNQVGLIAQEVEEFFPEIVNTDSDGFKSLDYSRLTVICLRVLKEVIKRLDKLETV